VDVNLFGDADILTVLGKRIGDTCRFWNVHSGAEQTNWIVHRPDVGQISAVAVSKLDGKVALAFANTVVLLDFVSGKEVWRERAGDGEYISRLKFSPDGRSLLSGETRKGTIRLWDFESGKKSNWVVTPPGRRMSMNCVFAIAPDGKTIATGGQDGMVRLWDMATAKEKRYFAGHQACITCLRFSPDGKRLASGSDDTTVLIWDLVPHSPLINGACCFPVSVQGRCVTKTKPHPPRPSGSRRQPASVRVGFGSKAEIPGPWPD
jgi:WD40 repeat protein